MRTDWWEHGGVFVQLSSGTVLPEIRCRHSNLLRLSPLYDAQLLTLHFIYALNSNELHNKPAQRIHEQSHMTGSHMVSARVTLMSGHLPIHSPIYSSVRPPIHPPIFQFIQPSLNLSIRPFICPFFHLSSSPSICLFIHPSTHPSIHQPINTSIHLSPVNPAIHPFIPSSAHSSIHPSFIQPSIHMT